MSVNESSNIDPNYVFKHRPKDYTVDLSPTTEYFRQTSELFSKLYNIPLAEAKLLVKNGIRKHKPKNPTVRFRQKQENGDMEEESDTLLGYIKRSLDEGEVIAPSFTTYVHPSKERSIHSKYLNRNIVARKKDKHMAFKHEQAGNMAKYTFFNTMQKIRKIYNNSLSGGYASKSTILNNPSAHYTLTSMTRSVASIGNMTSESMVAGNKYFKDPEVTFNYITALLANVDRKLIGEVIEQFNIHKPNAQEVFDSLFYSFKHYWRNVSVENKLLKVLKGLDYIDLAAILYCNDFWHFKEHNDMLTKVMFSEFSKKIADGSKEPIQDILNAPEGIDILAKQICMEEIRGKDVNYEDLGVDHPIVKMLGATCKNISNVMVKYNLIFKAFYTTKVMPTSVAYIRDMFRDTIVLSDTDSTCAAYDKWVEWYFEGKNRFDAPGVAIASVIMTINTQVIDHHLKIFARNMNIEQDAVELLKMKNEFYWPVFVSTNVSKHYFADTAIQEGNVYKSTKLELKGVHLIASSINPDLAKEIHNIMSDISEKIKSGKNVDLEYYLKYTADKEREIIKSIEDQSVDVFKYETIKAADSYKNEGTESPYKNHTLWENVFSPKYGTAGKPAYRVIKIPLTLKNKTKLKEFYDNIKDDHIRTGIQSFLAGKNEFKTFRAPVSIVSGESGIPEEFRPFINKHKIVEDNLKAMYMVLEAIGFYRKNDLLVSELGY